MKKDDHAKNRHKPKWLKAQLPQGKKYLSVKKIVKERKLATICQSGLCPNMGECWSAGTATFMILGDICTRNCTFCGVKSAKPLPPDPDEPAKVAEAVKLMKLKHCVITSVTRDDLPDKGAAFWAQTIREIKSQNPNITIEVLIPDFKDDFHLLDWIFKEEPNIISHNVETIKRLYKEVRPQANYERSLKQIKIIHDSGFTSKSGFMLGLGEKDAEVRELLQDLNNHSCDVVTIGQYLQPSPDHHEIHEFIEPERFEDYKNYGLELGIPYIESAPLVRSSYHSEMHIIKNDIAYNSAISKNY